LVNQQLTQMNWQIGNLIQRNILQSKRADYGEQIVSTLSQQLEQTYGNGWSKRHLWHCVRIADTFNKSEIVYALSTQLSWTHLRTLAAINNKSKRDFYTQLSIHEKWSTRQLDERIDSMLYERTALSKK